jgi:ppGpp synthetase/RelA/SpoT-type nucleotidyltranferase
LAEELATALTNFGIANECDFEAKERGYYAAHLCARMPVNILLRDFSTAASVLQIEIQITTLTKQLIKGLLHQHYEQSRLRAGDESNNWQWDYQSREFTTNYIGHMLHYLEGVIADLRTSTQEKKP